MRARLGVMVVGGGLMLSAAVPVTAHHSFATEFDRNKPVTLNGTITKMEWINPHAWIHVVVTGPNGETADWMVEAAAPNALFRRGVDRNSLPPGTEIIVKGFQSKDGSLRANGNTLEFPDGRSLFLGSSGTGAPYDEPSAR